MPSQPNSTIGTEASLKSHVRKRKRTLFYEVNQNGNHSQDSSESPIPWKNVHKFYWRSSPFKENTLHQSSQKRILFVDVTVLFSCSDPEAPCIEVYFGALIQLEDMGSQNESTEAKAGAVYFQSKKAITLADLENYASQIQIELEDTPASGLASLVANALLSAEKNTCNENDLLEERKENRTLSLSLRLHHDDLGETTLLIASGIYEKEWDRMDGYMGKLALDMLLYNLDSVHHKKDGSINESGNKNDDESAVAMVEKWWELAWNHHTSIQSTLESGLDSTTKESPSAAPSPSQEPQSPPPGEEKSPPKRKEKDENASFSSGAISNGTPLTETQGETQQSSKTSASPQVPSQAKQTSSKPSGVVRHRKVMHGRVRGNAGRRRGTKLKFKSVKH